MTQDFIQRNMSVEGFENILYGDNQKNEQLKLPSWRVESWRINALAKFRVKPLCQLESTHSIQSHGIQRILGFLGRENIVGAQGIFLSTPPIFSLLLGR